MGAASGGAYTASKTRRGALTETTMTHPTIVALALLLTAVSARAAQWPAPRLRLTELTGEMSIEPGPDGAPPEELPYIRQGSTVRILSGRAVFESDHDAVIRAKKGARFQVTTVSRGSRRPVSLRVATLGGDPSALEVSVASERFLPGEEGAAVSVTPNGAGAVDVRVAGAVSLITAADERDAESREYGVFAPAGVPLSPGDLMSVRVPERAAFRSPALGLAALRVSGEGSDATLVARTDDSGVEPGPTAVGKAVARWPAPSRLAVAMITAKYGHPNAISPEEVVWLDNGPWKRTRVLRLRKPGEPRQDAGGVLQQSVRYDLTQASVVPLTRFDPRLKWDPAQRELSARSGSEETNFLALNLADEIARGVRTPQQASDFYKDTVRLSESGKSSPYMESLRFTPPPAP
jgi:hypothetical protein